MNDSLFEIPEQLSPRLAWMREHGVTTRHCPGEWTCEFTGTEGPCWIASDDFSDPLNFTSGDTEDEAIVALAKENGWPLWNEVRQ